MKREMGPRKKGGSVADCMKDTKGGEMNLYVR